MGHSGKRRKTIQLIHLTIKLFISCNWTGNRSILFRFDFVFSELGMPTNQAAPDRKQFYVNYK